MSKSAFTTSGITSGNTSGGTGTVTSVATGTGLTGGTITTSGTITLANTAVTPASYTNSNITVDAQGRITAAANGTAAANPIKAWLRYNGVTQTVVGSLNIASVVYNSVGNYTINFTTPLSNANYCVTASQSYSSTYSNRMVGAIASSTSACTIVVQAWDGTSADSDVVCVAFMD